MRVALTGGCGFIGSNLVDALVVQGHEVLVVDDLSTGIRGNIPPETEFLEMDVLDRGLTDVFLGFGTEAVVHLAAQTDVGRSIADPMLDRRLNVDGTRAVARASAAAGARRVLSASSAAVYGEPAEIPLMETSRKSPENPYGSSKLEAETVLAEELDPAGVDFASLRFSNVYGPRQDWRGEGGVVAIFVARALRGEAPTIFGSGEQTRDFIYVGDVAHALLSALATEGQLAAPGSDGSAFNVSTGSETSVSRIAAEIIQATGFQGTPAHEPSRPGDVERSVLSPAKAEEAFGWRAETPLYTGIEATVRWFRDAIPEA